MAAGEYTNTVERLVPVDGSFRLDLAPRYLATSPSTIAEVVDEWASWPP
ncbi:MAG TPA: hypothetical protein VFC93_09160 [Chloroflexota bacterium]|nr:hypothetical protein [Chloroflexota bacterium]